jgi:hypothetical protein
MTKSEELTLTKSYPTELASAMQNAEMHIWTSNSNPKGGGENEKKNRDQRRKASADRAEPANSLSQRLVQDVRRANAAANAGRGRHSRRRKFANDLSPR